MPDEKPKPSFGNVQSGGSSTAPVAPAKPTPTGPAVAPATPRTYTVVAGDSLSKIAKKFYGDGNKYKQIFEANKDQLADPDKIKVGQKLKIPE